MNYSEEPVAPLKVVLADIRKRLTPKYGEGEAREMGRIIFENLKGWNPVELALRQNEQISEYIVAKIDNIINRLLDDEPIQQIFGQADFYGMKLKVSHATLIPRQETSELVDFIVKENRTKDLRILDAGTGSGCIAIALSRNLLFPEVTAIDISEAALEIARENATKLHARVRFIKADITNLCDSFKGEQFDIIVSNPPYIAEKEKATMERNVVEYEPSTALFVPDSEPLKFYIEILKAAQEYLLVSGGKIYFEINPIYANELQTETRLLGFINISLIRDTYGKIRFLYAEKENH